MEIVSVTLCLFSYSNTENFISTNAIGVLFWSKMDISCLKTDETIDKDDFAKIIIRHRAKL